MRIVKIGFIIQIAVIFCCLSSFAQENEPLELWYNQPAKEWMTEALPFGNAYVGAMVFGDVYEEHIQFSEGTLWSGGPGSNPAYNFGIKKKFHIL